MVKKLLLLIFTVSFLGCTFSEPKGLRKTERKGGPRVVFDLYATPFPEIPFPNDIATIPDSTTPTGLRLNVSMVAPTRMESQIRAQINQLDGFGIYSPISVRFDAPLDIENIMERHTNNMDFSDDAIFLINVDPASPHFGEAVFLDVGHGNFPITLEKEDNYFENDYRAHASNILFDTYNEDINHNGILDPGEDTDFDGVLDVPNTYPENGDPYDDLIYFYEKETNTLIVRPLLPLDEGTRYAVVITKRLIGENGKPVESPFEFINHTSQTEALRPLEDILPAYGLSLDDVAFAWTFTTQTATDEMQAIRKGLYGKGVFSHLSAEFPPEVDEIYPLHEIESLRNRYVLPVTTALPFLQILADFLVGTDERAKESVEFLFQLYEKYVDYFVVGSFTSPNFLVDKDGIAEKGFPADEDEIFDVDVKSGRAVKGKGKVYFLCVVPKSSDNLKPPFPVAIYTHGYTGSKLELLGFAGSFARFGIATCGIDAFGHGIVVPPDWESVIKSSLASYRLTPLYDALTLGRARDLNNDGVGDSGGDFWSADVFHTRDVVRQSVIDIMQFIRVMRNFGKSKWVFDVNGDGESEIAGDFNADGVVDFGGENDYYSFGLSLGGILSGVLSGIEPVITAGAPVCGGGGLTDIAVRSVQGGVVEAVFLRIFGLLIVGVPEGNRVLVKFILPDVNEVKEIPLGYVENLNPGDTVIVENLANEERDEVKVGADLRFRLSIPADAKNAGEIKAEFGFDTSPYEISGEDTLRVGDPLIIRFLAPSGEIKKEMDTFGMDVEFYGLHIKAGSPLVALEKGFGLKRCTPDLRRFFAVSQIILEPADPISYAPHYFLEPFDYSDTDPDVQPGSNVLIMPIIGDMNVPVNTGIAMARSAGIIKIFEPDPRYNISQNQLLINNYVIEGLEKLKRFNDEEILFDVDDLDEGLDGFNAPSPPVPLRATVSTSSGKSGMRMPYISPEGRHCFSIPSPWKDFDIDYYAINQIGWFFYTKGTQIKDDLCMADGSCEFFPR